MKREDLERIVDLAPHLPIDRQYWFVRTAGGAYYDNFIDGGYVAVGYNEIPISSVPHEADESPVEHRKLLDLLKSTFTRPHARHAFIANQLLTFIHRIKAGDVVICPSHATRWVSLGVVEDNLVYDAKLGNEGVDGCPMQKRRKVRWITLVPREKLENALYGLRFTHQAIVNANALADDWDRVMKSFYVKGGKACIVYEVQGANAVSAKALFGLGAYAFELFDEFCQEEEIAADTDALQVKINVQSPGFWEILAGTAVVGVLLAIFMDKLSGGSGRTSIKIPGVEIEHEHQSNSLLDAVGRFLAAKARTRIVRRYFEQLGVQSPEDVQKLVKALENEQAKGQELPPSAEPPNLPPAQE